jgi:hypothetical protein
MKGMGSTLYVTRKNEVFALRDRARLSVVEAELTPRSLAGIYGANPDPARVFLWAMSLQPLYRLAFFFHHGYQKDCRMQI